MSATVFPGPGMWYFGDYELLDELGRGGMGVVYKAHQLSLNRFVALKMILAGHLATATEVRRCHNEAEAVANLDHPHIVSLYAVGEYEGRHFFTMQLVRGHSLAQAVVDGEFQASHDGPLAQSALQILCRAVTIVSKVARAVYYAHQRGTLHRDLKPANILLDDKDEPHITDFGLARQVEADASQTLTGAVLGTPSYMALEQASGRTKRLSTAVDVYSLGAVLYLLLTGRPPFQAEVPLATLRLLLEQEPTRPSLLNQEVDPDLETICLKCLEKDPQRRYSSAEALAADLDRWTRHEPILARPATRAERLVKWCARKPVLAGLLAALAIVFVLGMGGIVWQWRRAELHAAAESSARQQADRSANESRKGQLLEQAERILLTPHANGWSAKVWSLLREATALGAEDQVRTVGAAATEASMPNALRASRVLAPFPPALLHPGRPLLSAVKPTAWLSAMLRSAASSSARTPHLGRLAFSSMTPRCSSFPQ
jgi:tRNA A-37 threonylcarbamoyl transferase component Bud32